MMYGQKNIKLSLWKFMEIAYHYSKRHSKCNSPIIYYKTNNYKL